MERGNGRCADGQCVHAEKVTDGRTGAPDGVLVTSTTPGNDASVWFTNGEWDTFIAEVKAGKWDDTVTRRVSHPATGEMEYAVSA